MNKFWKFLFLAIFLSTLTSCRSFKPKLDEQKEEVEYTSLSKKVNFENNQGLIPVNPPSSLNGISQKSSDLLNGEYVAKKENEVCQDSTISANKDTPAYSTPPSQKTEPIFTNVESLGPKTKELLTLSQSSQDIGFPNGINSPSLKNNTQISKNLKEWLNTFSSTKTDNPAIEDNPCLTSFTDRIVMPTHDISSSCLQTPFADLIASENSNKMFELNLKIPQKIPTANNSRAKRKSMGSVLPTSLLELTNELIIKVSNSESKKIEEMINERIPLETILEGIGLSSLVESNPVEAMSKLNETNVYKIVFANPLNSTEYTSLDEKILWYEPNCFINNLTLEANSFDENILCQFKIDDWWKWGIGYENCDDSGEGVTVAVIDTGVDLSHPGLIDSMWENVDEIPDNGIDDDYNGYVDDVYGWNFVDDNNDTTDNDGHGTHVAGIVPLIWHCKIMPVKVMDGNGGSNLNIYKGIRYAADNGAKVINMSLGGDMESRLLKEAITYAYGKGCIIVAAAGNSGGDISVSPARLHWVISVGGSNESGNWTHFSNYGDIFAPGMHILSCSTGTGLDKVFKSGTSMAAPFVAGVAAGMLSFEPDLSPLESLYNLKLQAINGSLNASFLNFLKEGTFSFYDGEGGNFIVRGHMCRILDAKKVENGLEITVSTKGWDHSSLDIGEGINPAEWKSITTNIPSGEEQKIILDTRDMLNGIYTIRLKGYYANKDSLPVLENEANVDKFTVTIDNGLDNNEDMVSFKWVPYCKINKEDNSFIEIENQSNHYVEITPIFYDLYGNEVRSEYTAVIPKGISIVDLKEYIPNYQGPLGIEVTEDIKASMSILIKDKNGNICYKENFIGIEEENMFGAAWHSEIPDKEKREKYLKDVSEYSEKIFNNIEDINDIPKPKLPQEVKVFLFNSSDENARAYISFFADGNSFDTFKLQEGFYREIDGYDFFRSDMLQGYTQVAKNLDSLFQKKSVYDGKTFIPAQSTLTTNFKWQDNCLNSYTSYTETKDIITKGYESKEISYEINAIDGGIVTLKKDNESDDYKEWQYKANIIDNLYGWPSREYSLITKLGQGLNEDGSYNVEWSSLTLNGPIYIPARSFVEIPTRSFTVIPFDCFFSSACMVTNIYPKGTVDGAIVIEKDGMIEEVIPLSPLK